MMTRLRRSVSAFAPVAAHVKGRVKRFKDDESGTIIIFGLTVFTIMLAVAGMSVDLMRLEQLRTALSQTLNRSVLAAASLTQDLPAKDVVEDYFTKAGLIQYLKPVTVVQTTTSSTVTAKAKAIQTNFFMNLIGVDTLPAVANSVATQEITDVEIMLVLDVSGSMTEVPSGASKTKIVLLKEAARTFVDTMMGTAPSSHVSIGMVPYNAQVNLGEDLFAKYTVSDQPNPLKTQTLNYKCVILPQTAFDSAYISRTVAIPQFPYIDLESGTYTGANRYVQYGQYNPYNYDGSTKINNNNEGGTNYVQFCGNSAVTNTGVVRTNPGSFSHPVLNSVTTATKAVQATDTSIKLPSNDPAIVKGWIDRLYARGNTSITLGMKWGLSLMDPQSRTMYSSFVSTSKMPAMMEGRPYDYGQKETLKVIVLMTDGIHVTHPSINAAYRTGFSPIWRATYGGKTNYSINLSGTSVATNGAALPTDITLSGKTFWIPHLVDNNNGATTALQQAAQLTGWDTKAWDANGATTAVRLEWSEVWAEMRASYVAQQLYARGLGSLNATTRTTVRDKMIDNFSDIWATTATMDSTLLKSCALAASGGLSSAVPRVADSSFKPVQVFTIAFDAPAASATLLQNCATKPTTEYAFAVGGDIAAAFESIASTISYLRLTQ